MCWYINYFCNYFELISYIRDTKKLFCFTERWISRLTYEWCDCLPFQRVPAPWTWLPWVSSQSVTKFWHLPGFYHLERSVFQVLQAFIILLLQLWEDLKDLNYMKRSRANRYYILVLERIKEKTSKTHCWIESVEESTSDHQSQYLTRFLGFLPKPSVSVPLCPSLATQVQILLTKARRAEGRVT